MTDLPTDKIISCFYGSSEDCVKVINTDGLLMSINPNGLKVMEIDDIKDIIGKQWLNFWQGNLQNKARDAMQKAKEGKFASFEGYCPTFKGNMKYWEVTIAPLFDDFNYLAWLLVSSRDVTKHKDLEMKVKELEKELRNYRLHHAKVISQ